MTTSTDTTLAAGSWALDPAHSSVTFAVRHLGIAKVRGRFARFETTFEVDDDGLATLAAVVYLDSFETGNADRDRHVRTADFLDVEKRPTMTFVVRDRVGITPSFTLTGDVTIGDRTAPLTLAVEWGGVQDFVEGSRHAGFSATGKIKRSDFGVGPQIPGLGDAVAVELDIELVEPR